MTNKTKDGIKTAAEVVSDMQKSAALVVEYFNNDLRLEGHAKKESRLKKLKLKHKSLAFESVAKKHAERLEVRVNKMLWRYKTNENSLRFVTLLDSVVELDANVVMDRVTNMQRQLTSILEKLPEIHMIAAFELEIFNYEFTRKLAEDVGFRNFGDKTKNKIAVLEVLGSTTDDEEYFLQVSKPASGSKVLVHIHAIVDFGSNCNMNILHLEKAIKERSYWNMHLTQLHIEKLHSTKDTKNNIKNLCSYMTKSGNEDLQYKIFYGRDVKDKKTQKGKLTTSELDAAIYKQPFENDEMTVYERRVMRNALYDEIAYENERSLTCGEAKFLNDTTYKLMDSYRRNTKEGYLLIL